MKLKSSIFLKNVVIWRQADNGNTTSMTASNLTFFVRSSGIIMISQWIKQYIGMKRSWLEFFTGKTGIAVTRICVSPHTCWMLTHVFFRAVCISVLFYHHLSYISSTFCLARKCQSFLLIYDSTGHHNTGTMSSRMDCCNLEVIWKHFADFLSWSGLLSVHKHGAPISQRLSMPMSSSKC